jgi:hypothetical protein
MNVKYAYVLFLYKEHSNNFFENTTSLKALFLSYALVFSLGKSEGSDAEMPAVFTC